MTCSLIRTKNGPMFICGSYKSLDDLKEPPQFCYICGQKAAVLCDAPAGYGKTCDRPMCREHSHNIGKDTDVCHDHYNDYEIEQAKLNRSILAKGWWPIQNNLYCPVCKSEEHSDKAEFCIKCGSKLKKEGL